MGELEGKVAVVTGGGYGIGREIALSYARAGAHLVLAARTAAPLEQTGAEIAALGGQALPVAADICKEEDCARIAKAALDRFGRIDLLVNNAGIGGPTKTTIDISLKDWQEVLDVNLTGAWLVTRAILPAMVERKSGAIVNIASAAGRMGYALRTPYAASKWAIIGLTQTWAREWGLAGIRVNCVSPGPVAGERIERVISARAQTMGVTYEEVEKSFLSPTAMRRMVTAEEIARVALFLASERSASLTGQTINVDAGFQMN